MATTFDLLHKKIHATKNGGWSPLARRQSLAGSAYSRDLRRDLEATTAASQCFGQQKTVTSLVKLCITTRFAWATYYSYMLCCGTPPKIATQRLLSAFRTWEKSADTIPVPTDSGQEERRRLANRNIGIRQRLLLAAAHGIPAVERALRIERARLRILD